MKTLVVLQLIICCSLNAAAQGTDCSNAISLNLNGSLNNYSTSSSTDVNVLCTDNGTTPVTWFQFTTNGSAQCPLLNITASDGQPVEIAMYTSCGGNMSNNLETSSSMCFYDGTGLWAPAETYVLSANTTYYLRVKTATACTISIGGQTAPPSNDECPGAVDISPTPIIDNNSCHTPGPSVTPPQLCASSLENTAFYQYYVATTGTTVINISNITCDNGANNVINGFQIGFFTGTCSNLTWLEPCYSGSGSFVQATSDILPANTKVYVAVDGNAGSNCRYSIQAINAYTLATEIKNFSAWKNANSTTLKWAYAAKASYFELERSENGTSFKMIGKINVAGNDSENTIFSIDDHNPLPKSYYRLKIIRKEGTIEFSKILEVNRPETENRNLKAFLVGNSLQVELNSATAEKMDLAIINLFGQKLFSKTVFCERGPTHFSQDISSLSPGQYFIFVNKKQTRLSQGFIKAH